MVINGYKLVREALVQRGEDYAHRPIPLIHYEVMKNKGIVCLISLKTSPNYLQSVDCSNKNIAGFQSNLSMQSIVDQLQL